MSTIEERVAALESALASMTAAEKRIVELPAASSVANDDFVALDGVANGSRRFAASNLGGKAEVMTEAEWDDLPDSKLTDGKVYALSGVSPSTQDNPLWQKLGFASLDTQADDCSDAINELNTGLTTLNSKLTIKSDTKTLTTNGNGIIGISSEFNLDMSKTVLVGVFLDGTYKSENYYTRNATTGAINYNISILSATASTYTRVTNTAMTVHIMYLEFN